MQKRKIFYTVIIAITLIILIIVLGMIIGIIKAPDFLKSDDNELDDMERLKIVFEKSIPTDIVILGDDIKFECDLEHRTITDLNIDSLKHEKKYQVIILNDLDDSITLSEENISLLSDLIAEDGTLLIYLGEKYSKTFDDPSQYIADVEDNLYFSYYLGSQGPQRCIGNWCASDQEQSQTYPYMLGQTIMYAIESYLDDVN